MCFHQLPHICIVACLCDLIGVHACNVRVHASASDVKLLTVVTSKVMDSVISSGAEQRRSRVSSVCGL